MIEDERREKSGMEDGRNGIGRWKEDGIDGRREKGDGRWKEGKRGDG